MKKFYLFATFSFVFQFISFSQLSCGDVFMDSGGDTGEYSSDEAITTTICPTGGQVVMVNFSEFLTESGYDSLTIFNGNSTSDAVVGSFQGSNSPGIVYSTNANGCLTFLFESDGSVTYSGWIASISCVAPITCQKPTNLSVNSTSDSGTTLSWTAGGGETQWMVEYDTSGFVLGTGTTVIANSNPFNISGLNATTNYDVYVYAICSSSDTSFASTRLSFTTDVAPFICGNQFFDNGLLNNYASNSSDTITICPSGSAEIVSVVFSSFETEENYDSLMVFNGATVNDPIIGIYQGNLLDSIGTITSTNPNGCLTFLFASDISFQYSGWVAQINCIDANASLIENVNDLISIYPNPSSGIFTISNLSDQNYNIQITDLKGAVIGNAAVGKSTKELNLNHLENGVYFLVFQNELGSFIKQINILN